MDFDKLKSLNKEFAENSAEFTIDFSKIYQKWLEKDPRLTLVMTLAMPLNVLFGLITKNKDHLVEKVFPEMPAMWSRYLSPWIELKDKWGVISSEQFMEEWGKLYEAQFECWFPSKEDKESFARWYKANNKEK